MDRRNTVIMAAGTIILGASFLLLQLKKAKRKRRSVWTKTWVSHPQEGPGILNMLREEDLSSFYNYLKMDKEHFDELLSLVKKDISKTNNHMRETISAKDRLSITLRFLVTGESYKSLMYSTRIHYSTISIIIPEVCRSIYTNLKKLGYIKLPQTEEEWKAISNKFEQTWNYPLCLGAIDGKHIAFRPPSSAGSDFFNYKGFHSLVLLAVVDSEYRFIYADAGVNGRISDGGVWRRSSLYNALQKGKINLPKCVTLPGREKPIPYHFIGDDAFSLSPHLMKPYPSRNLTQDKAIFNSRLSRARSVVENAFGMLSNHFRIFSTTINLAPEKVELIILTCVALHNFLVTKNAGHYLETGDFNSTLVGLVPEIGHNPPTTAKVVREELSEYFNQNPL